MEKSFIDRGVKYILVKDMLNEYLPYTYGCKMCAFYNYNGHECGIDAGDVPDPGIPCEYSHWERE